MTEQHTMRAMLLTGFGEVDQLQLAEVARPQPAPGEVLIQVSACGLNNTDLNLRKGWYSETSESGELTGWQKTGTPDFPIIQGADIVGEIVGTGEGVDKGRIGERVMVNPTIYKSSPENSTAIDFVGSERPGGFAEYVAVPSQNAYVVNTSLTDAELATFATSYLTAEHMLQRANVQSGETVLVTGASGGVGSALMQLIQARDAHAIAVVGREKADHAWAIGAKDVVIRDVPDLKDAVKSHVIDAVADVVGGDGFATLMDIVRAGGRIVTCGAIAGAHARIDLRVLYLRQLTLIGATLGTASEFKALVDYINEGKLKPMLAATYPLAQLREAQQAFEAKKHFGNIVIDVRSNA